MASFAGFFRSSVGKKVVVAITGLMLFGFVIIHLIGNLTMFIPDGGKAFNEYAHFLEGLAHGWFLTAAEIGLIAIFLIHAIYAVTVALIDKQRARAQKYAMVSNAGGPSHKTLASRSMIITGPLLLIFVIIHVWMFRFAERPPVEYGHEVVGNLFQVVVDAFQSLGIVIGYMAVMLLLATHLWHGVWSAFQSLGWNSDRHIKLLTTLSVIAAIVLGIGFFILPLYIHLFVDPAAVATGGH